MSVMREPDRLAVAEPTDAFPIALRIEGVHKALGGLEVLRGVDLDLRVGEVHALMGGNGAGKSTLIKCLSGYWKADAGTIEVNGVALETGARQLAVVQQDLGLIPTLSVAENIALGAGFATTRFGSIRWGEQFERAEAALEAVGHRDIDPRAEVRSLDSVQRAAVAIARAVNDLREGARILVLDEPTAALPFDEVNRLFDIIRRLKASGVAMLYVSHHLSEVMRISDRISVLSGGRVTTTTATADTDEARIVTEMLGREIEGLEQDRTNSSTSTATTRLRLRDLSGARLRGINVDIREGEILGVAGLQGSGCTELLTAIFGATRSEGSMTLDDVPYRPQEPTDAVRAGIALLTESRQVDGSFPDLAVSDNMAIADLRRFSKRGWIRRRLENEEVLRFITRFDIRPPDPQRRFSTMSGGNQQKAVLAKWLRLEPRVLLLDQPDVGVDVGARAEIYRAVKEAASAGTAVVLVSNQYDDLASLCDRVTVLRAGRIAVELSGRQLTEHQISLAVVGDRASEARAESVIGSTDDVGPGTQTR